MRQPQFCLYIHTIDASAKTPRLQGHSPFLSSSTLLVFQHRRRDQKATMAGMGAPSGADATVNAQSILSLRKYLNCHGLLDLVSYMEKMQDTYGDCSCKAVEECHASGATKDSCSTTLKEVALASKFTQEGDPGGCTVVSWLSKAETRVPAKLLAWICCCCEADFQIESLQGFRRQLRITVAATIIDDLMKEAPQDAGDHATGRPE